MINCEGITAEKFELTPFIVKGFGDVTNFELTYLYGKLVEGEVKKIIWINNPKTCDWKKKGTNQEKFNLWWKQRREAPEWCHPEIESQLRRYYELEILL